MESYVKLQQPGNEADRIFSYAPGTRERVQLLEQLEILTCHTEEIPLIIGGQAVTTGEVFEVRCPHAHQRVLARAYLATDKELIWAINAAQDAQTAWAALDGYQRAAIFLRAADLLAGPHRLEHIAAIMVNQSKTPFEAEIDLPEAYEILYGGEYDPQEGWFVAATLVLAKDPHSRLMTEEIFGPVLTVYVYQDEAYEKVLRLCDTSTAYGLTGAIFARDRAAIAQAESTLRYAAGNFYINDKPTGAVVGRQPFGGARHSGTNDKAGSWLNVLRWLSPRAMKETLVPARDWRRPYLEGSN